MKFRVIPVVIGALETTPKIKLKLNFKEIGVVVDIEILQRPIVKRDVGCQKLLTN